MKSVTSQKEAQTLQRLSFCYLCGLTFSQSSDLDREHVVARNIFRKSDRVNFPLILPSHRKCNGEQSNDDETIGQFVRMLHPEEAKSHKLNLTSYSDGNLKAGIISGVAFERIIWRWVRGFHASLYDSPLADQPGTYSLLVPLPEIKMKDGQFRKTPVREQFFKFAEVVRENQLTKNLDVIDCYNHTLRYECVWDISDCRKPVCIFALKIYDWSELGAGYDEHRYGCVGMYIWNEIPKQASRNTSLHFSIKCGKSLDPFEGRIG